MKKILLFNLLIGISLVSGCAQSPGETQAPYCGLPPVIKDSDSYNKLKPEEARVILEEGTEWAFSGYYNDNKDAGTYLCRQCNMPLFRSEDKFDSGSGWPSFDDAIEGAVREVPEGNGRYEIECSNCGGHLGHVFRGEGFTDKETRHCVNSVSIQFIPAEEAQTENRENGILTINDYIKGKEYAHYSRAVFAGGCFWCTEASFDRIEGVHAVISGYTGGEERYPTYKEVSSGRTGHAEGVIVFYDSTKVSYGTLLDVFFVAHDPTQVNRQGPDRGPQYRSGIFYINTLQKKVAEEAISRMTGERLFAAPIATEVTPYTEFWVAEAYHQNYFELNPGSPYIQQVSKPKVEKVEKVFKDKLKPVH